jgi:hypothetical protein
MWGNIASTAGDQVYLFANDSTTISYCDIPSIGGTLPVTGFFSNNTISDPEFVNPSAGAGIAFNGTLADWHLQQSSPCINAGTPDTTGLYLFPTDFGGEFRVLDDTIDIGAYEFDRMDSVVTSLFEGETGIYVYPNPVQGRINYLITGPFNGSIGVGIFDMQGKMLFSDVKASPAAFIEGEVDMSSFPKGLYFLWIADDKGSLVKRKILKY